MQMRTKKTKKLQIFLTVLLGGILVVSLIMIGLRISDYSSEKEKVEKAIEVAKESEPAENEDNVRNPDQETLSLPADPDKDFLADMDIRKLQEVNPDVLGWILIPGTEISYPLLQAGDNSYYLKHSWDGEENSCGSIFYDYRSSPEDWNAVIYGHNMRNGSMFAGLHNYEEENFCKDNDRLLILYNGEVREYFFVTAFEADLDGVPYLFGDITERNKQKFLKEISEKAGQPLEKSNSFVTLSTCANTGHETRWVAIFHAETQQSNAQIRFLNKEVRYQ